MGTVQVARVRRLRKLARLEMVVITRGKHGSTWRIRRLSDGRCSTLSANWMHPSHSSMMVGKVVGWERANGGWFASYLGGWLGNIWFLVEQLNYTPDSKGVKLWGVWWRSGGARGTSAGWNSVRLHLRSPQGQSNGHGWEHWSLGGSEAGGLDQS